jgi:CheY-like chemotaxis protein
MIQDITHQTGATSAPEVVTPRATVLNVEDYEPSRFLRSRLFRGAGYRVIEAASAGEALTAASRSAISLALVDVNLPDASGIALCETLKHMNPRLPVLLISAVWLGAERQAAGLAAGAHAYLAEPLAAGELLRSVADALGGGQLQADDATWVLTDAQGTIQRVSALGARLLSGSERGLQQRSLLVFFDQDRDAWRDDMLRAMRGERIARAGRLRPKERRPLAVRVQIEPTGDDSYPSLLWTFHTVTDA